jgi:hypothetical protein
MKMKLGDFAGAIATRVWDSVGRANWRPFSEASAFVHGLGLKSVPEWWVYCKSGKKPPDVPTNPHVVYADRGWVSMGDWLGTHRVATHRRRYLPFKKARSHVNGVKLKSQAEWGAYCILGISPTIFPPIIGRFMLARAGLALAIGLGLRSLQLICAIIVLSRKHVRKCGLKSVAKWWVYSKSGKKPDDIPANPQNIYLKMGWTSWGDWFGTGGIADRDRVYRPFEKTRGAKSAA